MHELRGYPAVMDGVIAVISGAGHRSGLAPGRLMMHDIHALVATYVLTGIALATLLAAALLELLPRATSVLRRLPIALVVVALAAASTSTSALVLGTTLQDGYVTAYATLPLVVAAMVLALRVCGDRAPFAFLLLGPAAGLTLFSWTPLAVLPLFLVLTSGAVALIRARRDGSRLSGPSWIVAAVVTLGSALVLLVVILTHVSLLHTQFIATGTITPPQPRILWLLGFLALALVAATTADHRWRLVVPLTCAVAGGVAVKFLIWLSPDGKSWTYYAWKTLYLSASALVWLAFVPVVLAITRRQPETGYGRQGGGTRGVVGVAGSLAALVLVSWSTPLTSPLDKAKTGWTQPSAGMITEVARVADRGQPFIFWHWSDPGNERLGEFWAVVSWGYNANQLAKPLGPTLPQGIPYWAYFEGGTAKDLCNVVRGVNGVYIISHDPKVRAELDTTCPNAGAHLIVEK